MKIIQSGYNYHEHSGFSISRPDGVGNYLLIIFRSPAYVKLGEETHHIDGNHMIIYRRDTPQYFGADNSEFINDWVQFELDDNDLLICQNNGILFDTIIHIADVYPISRLIELLWIERWFNNRNMEASKALLLQLLLLKISDIMDPNVIKTSHNAIDLMIVKRDIYSAPEKDWTIDNICKKLSISPSHLHYTYKQLFGTTIKEDVISARINRSKDLISNTNYSIARVAQMVGYENDVHFMYIFKKKTGFTPSQYRKSAPTTLG